MVSKKSPQEKFEKIQAFTKDIKFSVVGYCLFEIVHEYFSSHNLDIHQVNKILRILDPSQVSHWSMRAFSLNDNASIEDIFRQFPVTDIVVFSTYIIQEMCDRLSLFLGDDYANLDDCTFNCLFGEKIYNIECKGKSLSVHDYEISSDSKINIPKEFEDKIYISEIENNKTKLIFTEELNSRENIQFIKSQSIENQAYCEQIIYELGLKRAFKEIKEITAQYSIKILQKNDLGFIAIPLQIDTRGEILLIPNIAEGRVKSTFIKLDHKNDNTSKIIESRSTNLDLE